MVDRAQKMVIGYVLLKVETVKQSLLSRKSFAHHHHISLINSSELNQGIAIISSRSFSTQSSKSGRSDRYRGRPVLALKADILNGNAQCQLSVVSRPRNQIKAANSLSWPLFLFGTHRTKITG